MIRIPAQVVLILNVITTFSFGDAVPPANERFASPTAAETPDFQKHVVPLLGRLGCNGRSCHGSFQGRGGLRLSLFGYDFQMDHLALTGTSPTNMVARLDREKPDASLILQKPLLHVEHEGGERFASGSWQHHLLRRWIESGAAGASKPQSLSRLEIEPVEVLFDSTTQTALRVFAVWVDGGREDVTPLARFRTNNDSVVTVDADGHLRSTGPGDSHVVVFYDNEVVAVPVLRRHSTATTQRFAAATETAIPSIDTHVLAKLEKLGIRPSEICSDSEFLRRASIDVTGTVPTPDEVEAFLADRSSDKRSRKIDELLHRPAHAAWWANKLCDFTGCNPAQQAELGQETSVQWYTWIYERLRENLPYDQLVRRIVLARSRDQGQSYEDYAAQMSVYYRDESAADFARRETMPHYWTRRTMRKPEEAAQAFAHNFLGIRLQCAQCHKHPFAPWTQDDFREFSRFFVSVKFGVEPDSSHRYRELAKQVGLSLRDDDGTAISKDFLKQAPGESVLPWRELYIGDRDASETLRLLRSESVTIQGRDDPRTAIMNWMSRPENPWFAQAFVNRVWAGYFHVGIIEPPDDLHPANPPSNPALLAWLTEDFVRHEFDMKRLHRNIVSSDAYQRSCVPNETNRDDRRNFSRAVPRRLPAEVVYDSVKQALAADNQADAVRTDLTRRAIGHLSMRLAGTYAMQVFGKPDRVVNCDCERVNQPTLLQSVFLQNDPLIDQRLQESGWLLEIEQTQSKPGTLSPETLANQAWLRTLSRPPTDEEMKRAVQHLKGADSMVDGLRDLMWALMNTKEFILVR